MLGTAIFFFLSPLKETLLEEKKEEQDNKIQENGGQEVHQRK